ncbi:hypothetical protein Bca4012_070300 [Brassica carinata]|uniref:MORF/ORRM1/DAG-like MORF domain-containing protein n=1 Tax=Brassica carinata TaxID=52824 RepID=A0A8X7QCZ7_BRACI|nr:hypothetical protein Bca52824_062490 [Brassica carinata]
MPFSGLLIPLNLSIVEMLSERNSLSYCLQFAMASFTTSSSSSSSLLLPKTVLPVSHPTRSHTLSSGIFLTGKWNPMLRSISSTAGSRPRVAIVKAATVDSDYSSRRSSSNEQRETIMLPGCDYNHWLIVMDMEEAKKNMYAFSTTTYTGFQCTIDEETSEKFKGLPGVLWVLPDSYIDVKNKDYGGDKYINGEIIPCTYPTYQPKQRNNSKYQSKRYERKRDGPPPPEQQRKPRQAPPPPASDSS